MTQLWARKVAAACRDNFHLLILFSYHPFISDWLMLLLLKCARMICVHGACVPQPMWEGWRTSREGGALLPPVRGGVCAESLGFCRTSLIYCALWPHWCFSNIKERERQLTWHSGTSRGNRALASITTKPEGYSPLCHTWQLSWAVKAVCIFNLAVGQLVSSHS